MAYSTDIINRARQALESKKADMESQLLQRQQQVYAAIPRVKEIDIQLRQSMALAAQSVFSQGADAQAAFEAVKSANLALQQERQQLIDAQFGPNYLDQTSVCPKCGGNGYIGATMCSCLMELCRQEQEKEISLLAADNQRFDQFRLDYYSSATDPKFGVSPRLIMEKTFSKCKLYAEQFPGQDQNLLFVGGTGLGKTFLSACIARTVASKGCSVAYESAPHLFAKLEKERFNPDETSHQAVEKLYKTDLLIIDDLGTELPGSFVTAALYALVNDRLLAKRPMVISTNLTVDEIGRRYSPQIASRLQGNFQRLTFVGEDIRIQMNRG